MSGTVTKTRIGFVGVGPVGQCAHLRHFATIADCEVAALATTRETLGRAVAARYGIPRLYRSADDMLAAEKLDGIVAIQPYARHETLVPRLLQARIPVMIEKPLAQSVEAGERIAAAAEAAGTWVMVAYHKICDPAVEFALSEIARLRGSAAAGAMTYVRSTMPPGDWRGGGAFDALADGAPYADRGHARPPADADPERFRLYCRFINYYSHQTNLVRRILGEPFAADYADPSGVLLAGRSRGGTPCLIEIEPYRTSRDWQESMLICFQRAWVRLELPAPLAIAACGRVEVFEDPGGDAGPRRFSPVLPPVPAMRRQAESFVRALRGAGRPPCDALEALEDLRLARDYLRLWKETSIGPAGRPDSC